MTASSISSQHRVVFLADTSAICTALCASLRLWLDVQAVAPVRRGCLEQAIQLVGIVKEVIGLKPHVPVVVFIDALYSKTLQQNGVALESACMIRKELGVGAVAWVSEPSSFSIMTREPRQGPRMLKAQSLVSILLELERMFLTNRADSREELESADRWLRSVRARRRHFLQHALQPGKQFATALADAAEAIGIEGAATERQRSALAAAWGRLQETFGGPFIGTRATDPLVNDLSELIVDLNVWVQQACAGALELALIANEGPARLAKVVTHVEAMGQLE